MDNGKNILEQLFVDEDEVTEKLIAELLSPNLGLSKTADKVVPKARFSGLSQTERLLLYLLARHAMVRLKVPGASLEAVTARIAEESLLPQKSCGETLSRLKASGLVGKNKAGYFVPTHSLLRVSEALRKGNKNK